MLRTTVPARLSARGPGTLRLPGAERQALTERHELPQRDPRVMPESEMGSNETLLSPVAGYASFSPPPLINLSGVQILAALVTSLGRLLCQPVVVTRRTARCRKLTSIFVGT